MKPAKLMRMAEQIAANVTVTDDVSARSRQTADHLRRFWDPRMRTELLAHVESDGPAMSEAVRGAVALLRRDAER